MCCERPARNAGGNGLGLGGDLGRNAGEIAIQCWHVKRRWAVPLVKEGQRSRRC
jgi:hypothetical protein